MKIIDRTDIGGHVIIQGKVHKDHRGSFEELHRAESYRAIGLPVFFPQENMSTSRKGTIRGLHFQDPNPQGKLVRVLRGSIYDVCVDLRPSSRTFREYRSVILDASRGMSAYIPEGCAHGFLAMDDATILYRCTTVYDVESDRGINYADPELKIPWHIYLEGAEPVLSEKDMTLPTMAEYLERL
jgi:dTDP-4-dehydrorhamnose 3,5-epimerase